MNRRTHHCHTCPTFLVTLLLCLGVFAAFALPAQSLAALSGKVPIVMPAPKSIPPFTHAVLYVDGKGNGATNTLPLRFDLDTTTLTDGKHMLYVVLYDQAGVVATLPKSTVVIANNPQSVPNAGQQVDLKTPIANGPVQVLWGKTSLTARLMPYIDNDRTMVLLRPLIILAGGTITWDKNIGSAVINNRKITFTMNDNKAVIDKRDFMLVRPIVRKQNRIYAPVTLWLQLLDGMVDYHASNRSVLLYNIPQPQPNPTK